MSTRIKSILEQIIDVAYAEESEYQRRKYKDFTIKIMDTDMKTKNGDYHPTTKTIRVLNPSHGSERIAKTCLHELSHHIDYVKNGTSNHKQPFYDIYAKLIYAALDMGVLKVTDFDSEGLMHSSDYSKVQAIVSHYRPIEIEHNVKNQLIVLVQNCYAQKDQLKAKGFKWDPMEKAWSIVINDSAEGEAKAYLENIGCKDYKIKSMDLKLELQHYVKVTGDTYQVKEILKEHGFSYKKEEKCWIKYIDNELEGHATIASLHEVIELPLAYKIV